jgi:hypothetical protein
MVLLDRNCARCYTALRNGSGYLSMAKIPTYRIRGGYDQALVTLTDARTKKRRDYWLGPALSPETIAANF